jgi:hypothetical protein
MRIYLVQSGGSLNGSDGYSYGLLRGNQTRLLVSFVDFMKAGKQRINPDAKSNRRKLIVRAEDRKKVPT